MQTQPFLSFLHIANPITTAPPTTATTSHPKPLVALAMPFCNPGFPLPLPPVADAAGAPTPPPVTGASTTVTEVIVDRVPSGKVNVDSIVEEEGVNETSSLVASTVIKEPATVAPFAAVEPETEKTILPFEVAIGVADEGLDLGIACVVGALVAVVREEAGRTIPLLVFGWVVGDASGDWERD
jgi:hypothetical protein